MTAAAARAVSDLHHPIPTTLGVEACAHCTALHSAHGIILHPCPTHNADARDRATIRARIADAIEAEEHRISKLTPGDDDWRALGFRMGMLHAAAIVRADQ